MQLGRAMSNSADGARSDSAHGTLRTGALGDAC